MMCGLTGCSEKKSDASETSPATDLAGDDTDSAPPTDDDAPAPADSALADSTAEEAGPADTGAADAAVTPTNTCVAPESAAVANASVPDGFCASIWADDLADPRGLFVTDSGDVLVVERGHNQVTVLWDDDGDGVSGEGERAKLAAANRLNHGVTVYGGHLYASSATTVWRWPYAAGARSDLGTAELVVRDIPSGGHNTRTLAIDRQGLLYVSVGSAGNVDADSRRSRVRRFDLSNLGSSGTVFSEGEVFADGLRNEVGLAFDAQGRLWGVQNGIDNLTRTDLGGDIHDDNPAEILSLLDTPGAFHGYPYCWTEFLLPDGVGLGPGTMWAHPNSMNDGTHDDAWCRDPENVDPPELAMQAHAAPLDLEFYDGGSFPASYRGDLFVTFHGSWNRTTPTGYKVVHVDFDDAGRPQPAEPFFEYSGAGDIAGEWRHRPVGVRVAKDGKLLVSSDRSGVIIAIGHEGR